MRQELPDWLKTAMPETAAAPDAIARTARNQVESLGLPGLRDEEWRWTNLRAIQRGRFNAPSGVGADIEPSIRLPLDNPLRLRFIDGVFQGVPNEVPEGLTLSSLADADEETRQAAFSPTPAPSVENPNDALVTLNTAMASEGVVIDVAANANIERPIVIEWLDGATESVMSHPRVLIRLGQSAAATVIEHIETVGEQPAWRNSVIVSTIAANAALTHIALGLDGASRLATERSFASLERDARYHSYNIQLAGQMIRREYDIQVGGSGAHTDLIGLMMPRGKQVLDTHTRITHAAADTTSNEHYRTIADDAGRGIFKGRILIEEDAQRIQAYQSSNNLILSDDAEIDAKPELEIYADDVSCSHGATIGRLDQEALFYLRSRGLGLDEARGLLIAGFAQEVIDEIPLVELRDWLTERVEQRLGDRGTAGNETA
ncbi:Fe-S cluster assembly protein SufD [Guyparkeria sp. SCN-R1]|uniref:Fe-S cluster assembly protein SufD n=1 Tax=Guyparkeria sp. SCN-R1 TaxID=2341113 RepID=UPI000F652885|nr:Fe-S cluster assembly protein SufD [Guyparkeria sp. SCN-R1]RRQ20254.1 Fe-S cluster assembly protein SufD [Guyparkeria sp. SCN-R1]